MDERVQPEKEVSDGKREPHARKTLLDVLVAGVWMIGLAFLGFRIGSFADSVRDASAMGRELAVTGHELAATGQELAAAIKESVHNVGLEAGREIASAMRDSTHELSSTVNQFKILKNGAKFEKWSVVPIA